MNKLAVIMSIYKNDRLDFLQEAVESILNQTYIYFDFLIAFDGKVSEDMDEYLSNVSDTRIKIFKRDENKGLAFTLNELVVYCLDNKYEYIARMDADDISFLHRFEKTLSTFKDYPALMLIGSECEEIDENGTFLNYKKMPHTMSEIKATMYTRCPFIHPSVIFRKEFFESVGLYDVNFTMIEDLDLWSRAIIKGVEMANIDEALLKFRLSSNYWERRSSWDKIIKELIISINFVKGMKSIRGIHKIIIGKFFGRTLLKIMPTRIKGLMYKKLRN